MRMGVDINAIHIKITEQMSTQLQLKLMPKDPTGCKTVEKPVGHSVENHPPIFIHGRRSKPHPRLAGTDPGLFAETDQLPCSGIVSGVSPGNDGSLIDGSDLARQVARGWPLRAGSAQFRKLQITCWASGLADARQVGEPQAFQTSALSSEASAWPFDRL